MERWIYNGDILDKTGALLEKQLVVNSCGIHQNSTHRTIRKNGRKDYTILFVISGQLCALMSGSEQVYSEGTLILYPPNVKQDYYQMGGAYAWVHITGKSAQYLMRTAFDEQRIINFYPHKDITNYFERMIFHFSREKNGENLAIYSDLLTLLAAIERKRKEGEGDSERLRKVIVEMNAKLSEPTYLKDYAAVLGLSEGRFCHLFKEIMGKSPHAYILEIRLNRAAEMLLDGNSVSSVAYAVGFSDPLYFSRIFKKRFGKSPKAFQQN